MKDAKTSNVCPPAEPERAPVLTDLASTTQTRTTTRRPWSSVSARTAALEAAETGISSPPGEACLARSVDWRVRWLHFPCEPGVCALHPGVRPSPLPGWESVLRQQRSPSLAAAGCRPPRARAAVRVSRFEARAPVARTRISGCQGRLRRILRQTRHAR